MGNKNYKGKMTKKVMTFLNKKNIFPCTLKSDSNGKIIKFSGCFIPISLKKIDYREERRSEFKTYEIENEDKNDEIGTLDIQTFLDISCFHCDSVFKRKAEKLNNYSNKITSSVGKYILYSFSIRPEHISLDSYWLNRFKDITNSFSTDMEKAKQLDEIFKTIGFFIPLEIKVGGSYIYHTENMYSFYRNNSLINFYLNSLLGIEIAFENNIEKNNEKDKNKSLEINGKFGFDYKNEKDESKNRKFFLKKTKISGGNIYANDYDEWKNSLTFNNSEIIEFSNIMSIKNILDNKIRNILKRPLEIVEKRYKIRKEYYDTIQYLKNLTTVIILKELSHFVEVFVKKEILHKFIIKNIMQKENGNFYQQLQFQSVILLMIL